MSSTKKSQESTMKLLRDLASLNDNRVCFDCNQRGPTYVNISIGSFVCTGCGGALRKYNQRIKSISMSNFSPEEIIFLKRRGNKACQQIYMALFKELIPRCKGEYFDDFLRQKYELKKWYQEPGPELEETTLAENQEMLNRLSQTSAQKNNKFGTNATSGLIILSSRSTSSVTASTPSLTASSTSSGNSLSNISCPALLTDPSPVSQQQQIRPIPPPERCSTKSKNDPFSLIDTSKPTSQPIDLQSFASFDNLISMSNPFSVPPTPIASNPSTFSTEMKNVEFLNSFSLPKSCPTTVFQASTAGVPTTACADKYAALAELDGLRKFSDVPTSRLGPHSSQFAPVYTLSTPTIPAHLGSTTSNIIPLLTTNQPSSDNHQSMTPNPFKLSMSAFSPPLVVASHFNNAPMSLSRSSTLNPFAATIPASRALTNPFLSSTSHSSQNPFINSG